MLTTIDYAARQASALEAKVQAHNAVNAELNRLSPLLLAALAPLKGQKIELASGGLTKKAKALIDAILPEWKADGYTTPTSWVRVEYRSLKLSVKIAVSYGEHSCVYAENIFYAGTVGAGILEEIAAHPSNYRTDYSAEAVRTARKAYEAADQAMRTARAALDPFGQFDQ